MSGKVARPRKGRPRVVTESAGAVARCRCGAQISGGSTLYWVTSLPNPADGIFEGVVFCSPKCIHAFCLESLEALDAMDVPSARSTVTDLHELTLEVAKTLVALL